jgi:hypothetical protein
MLVYRDVERGEVESTVNDRQKVNELQKLDGLDLGESEAIALAAAIIV